MIYEQKGYPNVYQYPKMIKERINGIAKTEFAPAEEGKKKILELHVNGVKDFISKL